MVASESEEIDLWWLGVSVYVVGSVLINLGSNMIRKGHAVAEEEEETKQEEEQQQKKWYSNWWWSGGFLLFGIGNILNFMGFMFAAQSLLVCLGSIQFLANFVFARSLNKEKITTRSLLSVGIIVIGILLVVSYGSKTTRLFDVKELGKLLVKTDFLVFLIIEFLILIILQLSYLYLQWRYIPQCRFEERQPHPFIEFTFLPLAYAIVSVIVGTQSIVAGKMLSGIIFLTIEVPHSTSFLTPWPYLIGLFWFLTSAFYIQRLNQALKFYDVLFIIPTLQGLWLFFGALEGGIYFQELAMMSWTGVGIFCLGLTLIVVGVMILAAKKRVRPTDPDLQIIESVTCVETNEDFFPSSPMKLSGSDSLLGECDIDLEMGVNSEKDEEELDHCESPKEDTESPLVDVDSLQEGLKQEV